MKYKNCGPFTETHFGIVFKPGEIKSVPGTILSNNFVRCFDKDVKKSEEKPSPGPKSVTKKAEKPNIVKNSASNTNSSSNTTSTSSENKADTTVKNSKEKSNG